MRLSHHLLTVLATWILVATASLASPPRELDLREAILLARSNNKLLQSARIRIEEAQGDLTTASILLIENPELGLAAGPRSSSAEDIGDTTDLGAAVEQRFEIGGQRRHRIRRAEASLAATEASAEDAQRVLELAVAKAFWEALTADQRVKLLQESLGLARSLYDTARLRLERGEATPLEQNTARIRLAEVERRMALATAQRRSVVLRLSELLGLPPAEPLVLKGQFPEAETLGNEESLVARALESRFDLVARDLQVVAAEETARLAEAEAWPDLSLGIAYEEEEDDKIILLGLSVPLPFFDRNQGERQRTEATARRLQFERAATELAVESEVRRAYSDYEQARQAMHLYSTEVLNAQEESLGLLQRAFEAGQIGYPELIVVQREVLIGREGYLGAQLDFALAHARLLAASQQPQIKAEQE
jgi:cobalt-zinc-cadmium efflux system outer membrane protein